MSPSKIAAPLCGKREQEIKIVSLLHNFSATEVKKISKSKTPFPNFSLRLIPRKKDDFSPNSSVPYYSHPSRWA